MIKLKRCPSLRVYEPTLHEPVSRVEPASPVLNRFLPCFCGKPRIFGINKIINRAKTGHELVHAVCTNYRCAIFLTIREREYTTSAKHLYPEYQK